VESKLLTIDEVAEMLVVSPRRIREMVARSQIPFVRLSERGTRFQLEDLERWLEERKRDAV
jgi:excisionase family DNA binding protein